MTGAELAARLRDGDLSAAPAALNLIESTTEADRRETASLLRDLSPAALGGESRAHIIGVTGPPGVGKSTLLRALVTQWRARRRTVAALAVDPSSKRSGGALLGDRVRIAAEPTDRGVFVRSSANAQRLGGLAPATRAAAHALAAAFDVVVLETVGVGQAETDVADVADTVLVALQPGSGDVLQFLKAGIMEIPDLLVVTKADMGAPARLTLGEARAALVAAGSPDTPALAVSCREPSSGIEALVEALDEHRETLDLVAARLRSRRAAALSDFITEYGEHGLRRLGGRRAAASWLAREPPGLDVCALVGALDRRARAGGDQA